MTSEFSIRIVLRGLQLPQCRPPCLHLGGDTHKIPLKLFAVNRERLCSKLKEEQCPQGAVVVLQGGEQQQRYCTDTDEVFRQVNSCVIVHLLILRTNTITGLHLPR